MATGILTQPKLPEIVGIKKFNGTIMHSARWNHKIDLANKKVAIIGTGASALQIIPEIAPLVKSLSVFQRTPIWVLPKLDSPMNPWLQNLFKYVPGLQSAGRLISQSLVELCFVITANYHRYFRIARLFERIALDHLDREVKNPTIRAKLTPQYGFGCKRPSISNEYLRTFNRDNVELITAPIDKVTENGIVTNDTQEYKADILICATGFKVFETGNMPPFPITGVDGRDLEKFWDSNRYQAYEGVSIPGFPNMFAILGPNGYNGASYFQLIEMQSRHIVRCLKASQERNTTSIEVSAAANDRYFREMKARAPNQLFFSNRCETANSYYFDKHGDVPFRPATSLEAHWRSMTFDLDDYEFTRATVS